LYFKDLELHTIELKKFSSGKEALDELIAKIKSSLDLWVAFLTRHELLNKERLPESLNKPVLKKALNVLEVMNFVPEEREAYEEHLKWLRIEANTLKKYHGLGFEEGIAEGIEQGIDRGIKIGEQAASIKIANTLLAEGISTEKVASLTGLTETEVKELMSNKPSQ
jgi:predicted transposase/invertase (TIGR01784 family)